VSNGKPSLFAYPPLTKQPKKEQVTKVATAVLSTTAKAKAREKKKAAEEGVEEATPAPEDVEMDTSETESPNKQRDISPLNGSLSNLDEDASKASKKKEPSTEIKANFTRVTPSQMTYITFQPDSRYVPVRPVSLTEYSPTRKGKMFSEASQTRYGSGGGIIVLQDTKPDEEAEYVQLEPETPPPEADDAMQTDAPATAQPTGPHIALDADAPEAEVPPSFEVSAPLLYQRNLTNLPLIVPFR
jgi:26S proteasome regulatory subunit N2